MAQLDLTTTFIDGETIYAGAEISRVHQVLGEQAFHIHEAFGNGVYKDAGGSLSGFEVTPGTGSSIVIAPGSGIATHSSKGTIGIKTYTPVTISGLSDGSYYVFATVEISTNDTRETRLPKFIVQMLSTNSNGIPLARITVSGGSVTIDEDLRVPVGVPGAGDVSGPASSANNSFATFNGTTGKLIKDSGLSLDTNTGLASNDNFHIPTTAAVRNFFAASISGRLYHIGDLDCSSNPNYPAANNGSLYLVTVAGKIGGASGKPVNVGDAVIAKADDIGGDEAAVGSSWYVLEASQVDWDNIANKPATFIPAAHASTHCSGGSDALKLDALAAPDDNTDLNATNGHHGLLRKLDSDATHFLRGDGEWAAVPSNFSESGTTVSGSDSNTRFSGGVIEARKTSDGANLGGGFISGHAGGVPGTETALPAHTRLGIIGGAGYDGDADLNLLLPVGAAMVFKTSEDWDSTAHGARITFEACPLGSSTRQTVGRLAAPVVLTDASTIAIDAQQGGLFDLTLTADGHELGNPTNAYDGQVLVFRIRPATHTLIFPATGSKYRVPPDTFANVDDTGPTLSTAAVALDRLYVEYVAADDKFDVVEFIPGYGA